MQSGRELNEWRGLIDRLVRFLMSVFSQRVEVKDVPSGFQTMTETKNIRKDLESRAVFYNKQIILIV